MHRGAVEAHMVPALEEHPAWTGWGVVCRQPVMLM